MPWVTEEEIQAAKNMTAYEYLRTHQAQRLQKTRTRNEWQLTDHDSFKINELSSKWHWKSRDIGGVSALRFLIEVDGMKFDAAHDRVKKEILYKNVFTEAEKKFLPLYEAAVKRTEKRLRVRFLPILENQKERTEHRMFFGKRLDMRTIADPGGVQADFSGKENGCSRLCISG